MIGFFCAYFRHEKYNINKNNTLQYFIFIGTPFGISATNIKNSY